MENGDTGDGSGETSEELPPGPDAVNANNQTKTPKKATKTPSKHKQWSLWQHWKRAKSKTRLKWFVEAMGVLLVGALVGNAIWQNLQTMSHFSTEHRPRVIFIRPPELLGQFECEVTDKEIRTHSGQVRVWLKNIKNGDAVGAFIAGPNYKLVPEKKTGDKFLDDSTLVTDDSCKAEIKPKMKQFPVNEGQEIYLDMARSDGVTGFYPGTSATIHLDKPINPASPLGGDESTAPLKRDDLFQLYAPLCVYYFDEEGNRHGTCMTYRLNMNGRYTFSCTQTPITGTLEQVFLGYCED
jgi:hypothetical protein